MEQNGIGETPPISEVPEREKLEKKFSTSRNNLLAVIVFTVVNIVLALFDAGIAFLFSAMIPTTIIEIALYLSEPGSVLFGIAVFIVFLILASYTVCYFASKKIKAFILVALIFFAGDVVFLLWLLVQEELNFALILQAAFHVWVTYYLLLGVKSWARLKKLGPEEAVPPEEEAFTEEEEV